MELLLKDCGVICVFAICKVNRELSGNKLDRLKLENQKDNVQDKCNEFIRKRKSNIIVPLIYGMTVLLLERDISI